MTENKGNLVYENKNNMENLSSYNITEHMNPELVGQLIMLNKKIDLINNGYTLGRKKIENECEKIKSEINNAVQFLIDQIQKKRDIMITDVDLYKNEALMDHKERYHNEKVEKMKKSINSAHKIIFENFDHLCNSNKLDSNDEYRCLIERISSLNTKINDSNNRLIPDLNSTVNILFSKSDQFIHIPFIGDITYESVSKIDMVAKISHLNNYNQQRLINLDHLMDTFLLAKFIGLISKNKILILYEKVYGKVTSIFLKIGYLDGTLLYEQEVRNKGSLNNYCIYDNNILVHFRKGHKDHIIHLYDTSLKLIQDHAIYFDIESLLMNDDSIFLISEKKPFVNEFDFKLNYKKSYGQKTKEQKAFYVKDEIFAITDMKIFVKMENEVRLLNRANGEFLCKIDFDDLKISTIFLDFNKEKYLVFNGFDKLSYYNHKGELIISSKLRIKEVFNQFQYSRSGHFAFINNKKNIILVI
ncbi:unnamed protein product [Brachionus calyciflorus]|uniref:Uncharacterized protein n=1 Tax=Brachionus calyciflorus TaxID=104777 RepID=A0A814LNV5_9BILA|nr:unnamed protein product [Brachionus calyciflorus]